MALREPCYASLGIPRGENAKAVLFQSPHDDEVILGKDEFQDWILNGAEEGRGDVRKQNVQIKLSGYDSRGCGPLNGEGDDGSVYHGLKTL